MSPGAFFKALREFRQAEAEFEAEAAGRAESAPAPAPPSAPPEAEPSGSLGSFREEDSSAHPGLTWDILDGPPEAKIVQGPGGLPLKIGRPARTGG